jgi:hypothetical protein
MFNKVPPCHCDKRIFHHSSKSFFPFKNFQPSLMFVYNARAYSSGWATENIRLGCKGSQSAKTVA